jgi:hypothetical protein
VSIVWVCLPQVWYDRQTDSGGTGGSSGAASGSPQAAVDMTFHFMALRALALEPPCSLPPATLDVCVTLVAQSMAGLGVLNPLVAQAALRALLQLAATSSHCERVAHCVDAAVPLVHHHPDSDAIPALCARLLALLATGHPATAAGVAEAVRRAQPVRARADIRLRIIVGVVGMHALVRVRVRAYGHKFLRVCALVYACSVSFLRSLLSPHVLLLFRCLPSLCRSEGAGAGSSYQ